MLRRMSSTLTSTVTQQRHAASKRVSFSSTGATSKTFVPRPWNVDFIDCHGDYRDESWLESHIGGPLYAHQRSLPRLPVPTLAHTLKMFLPTALPLARTVDEVSALERDASQFSKQAAKLQERLVQRARKDFPDSSFLQVWWNQMGYLQVRDSVVINVSYFFHFADDPTAATQTQRAAALLYSAAECRRNVVSGMMHAEAIGKNKTVLCSTAYKYMFHACRIPAKDQDSYKIYDPSRYTHAVVASRGHFYKVALVDPVTHTPYGVEALVQALDDCQAHAGTRSSHLPLGVCTSNDRDDWAAARAQLLQFGGVELEEAIQTLESGAVLVCLDDEEARSRVECAKLFLHSTDGTNRWFDKSIQLIVSANGKAGLLGEHSMMDGMPVVQLADCVAKATYESCRQKSNSSRKSQLTAKPIFTDALLNRLEPLARPLVEKSKQHFLNLTDNNSLDVQSFQGFGGTFIKKAGFSPDAFVQMAMQLATYRLWGEQAGTYEATQVRPFLHGRTETTRTVSTESADFVQRFGLRPQLDEHDAGAREEKLKFLKDAVTAHVKYIGQAARAQGVDRHFFALSLLASDGEPLPDLYSNPVFGRAKKWRVSTSHLTHPKFDGWGYGQVVPDGVGLAYSIHPRHCIFNVTALKQTGWTEKLCTLLEEAMLELRTLIELDSTPGTSKL